MPIYVGQRDRGRLAMANGWGRISGGERLEENPPRWKPGGEAGMAEGGR